jgi:hypothetical protein
MTKVVIISRVNKFLFHFLGSCLEWELHISINGAKASNYFGFFVSSLDLPAGAGSRSR